MGPSASLSLCLSSAVVLAGCGAHQLAMAHPLSGCAPRVDGDRIFCDGRLFAVVESYRRSGCRALAVRYAGEDPVWLYRAPNFDPDHPDDYVVRPSSMGQAFAQVFDIVISADGRTVRFKKPGVLGPSAYEYDIAAGVLREIEKARTRTDAR